MSVLATVRDEAASAALWGLGLGWMAAVLPPLTLLQRRVPSHAIDGLTRIYTKGQIAMTLCRWRAEVDPAVDPDRPYLFVQNHVNVLDHCTAYHATPHIKTGIELAGHFRIPVYGPFMRSRGTIGLERDDPAHLLTLRRRMRDELAAGRSLIAFPEGTRTRDGRVGPFHTGLFHVARALRAEVVPVALTGMQDVLRTGRHRMRPLQEVTVHVLSPMPTAELSRDEVPAFTASVRARIADVVDAWRATHPDPWEAP